MSVPMTTRTDLRFGGRTVGALAMRIVLGAASRIRVGCLSVVLPDGRRHVFGDPSSARRGEIRIHDEAVAVRLLLHGDTGVGEAYVDGQWSSPDLEALIELAALNRSALGLAASRWRMPLEIPRRLAHRSRRNTKAKAREKELDEKARKEHDKDGNPQPPKMKKPGEKTPEMKTPEAKKPNPETPKKRKKNQERAEDETSI